MTAPYRTLSLGGGEPVPWYMLEFDKKGKCESEDARAGLLADLRDGDYSDVYLFCHGWNNSWKDAVGKYEAFITGYTGMRGDRGLALDRPERALLIGVYWPSAILVLPGESAPSLAGPAGAAGEGADAEEHAVGELASELADEDVARFYELANQATLPPAEAEELAALLGAVYEGEGEDPFEPFVAPSTAELLQLWSGEPALFGGVFVKVRDALRAATVWLMKDRAGRVGERGLAPLLRDVLDTAPTARLHLVAHSFGCRALLAALSAEAPPRPVNSVLLLQGAVNHLCFALDATGEGQAGGFRPALAHVEQPVLATFSDKDASLTRFFHLALRRPSDLGERELAVGPPSRFAALGGYGPGGCGSECEQITMPDVGTPYPLGPGPLRVVGVDGSATISNHGDVSNPATWWTLWCQVSGP